MCSSQFLGQLIIKHTRTHEGDGLGSNIRCDLIVGLEEIDGSNEVPCGNTGREIYNWEFCERESEIVESEVR